jgi:AcrR family transcriptional regulator
LRKQSPPQRKALARISRRPAKGRIAPETRRDPRQERSRETVSYILQAAAQVFGRLGYAGATTNKIAERAGVSIGSLYQYFGNKDEILRVLLEKHHREVHDVIDGAHAKLADPDIPLDHGLRHLLDGLLELHANDPALSRVLALVMHGPEGRRVCKDEEDDRYFEEVKAILEQRPEVRFDDADTAARLVVQTVELLTRWLGHEAPKELNARDFVDEMLTMLLSYLTGNAPEPGRKQ